MTQTPYHQAADSFDSAHIPVYARAVLEADDDPGHLNLFLIEDDEDIALLISKSLERAGHVVTRCRTAADALIVLAQRTFDMVILDNFLPDMPGLTLLDRFHQEGFLAPVLMITARGNENLATQALRGGALDYIVKDLPLTFLAELPKRVSESVRRFRLENMNRLLIQALESTRDGVMITDLQGTILKVNQALVQLTGFSRQELIGNNPRLLNSGRHPRDFFTRMWQTILGRQSWQGELANRRKDGQIRPTSMTISPIVDVQGRLTHFVGIQRDITEHKRLEQQMLQMQKMQSVGTLAGGIAHEFNNLMAGINGYASLGLREPSLSPTMVEFLQNIVDLSERAATLTRQLLAFARKPALIRQKTVIHDLLRATAELVRRTLHQPVELDLPRPMGRPLYVEADGNQLQQALLNLALNARDSLLARQAEEGLCRVGREALQNRVVFRLQPLVLLTEKVAFPQNVPPGDYVLVQIEDTGTGMPADVLAQALDPFFTTKEVGQGTGLGLPMVFGIVQGHQGYLTIDSVPGHGTTVGLYLPRYEQVEQAPPSKVVSPGESIGLLVEPDNEPGRTILVIDDEEPVLDVVRRFLEIAGHKVQSATSGSQAIQLAEQMEVNLVILDLMMPREDTAAIFKSLRQAVPNIPVLLCTGLADAQPAPWVLSQPRTCLLRKPFRMNELWYAVREALAIESLTSIPERSAASVVQR
ncbi:MAG: response regulator [Gemmataceae bacterium]